MSEAVSLAEAASVRVPEPVVVKPSRLAELPKGNDELASVQPVPAVAPALPVEVEADQVTPSVVPVAAELAQPSVVPPAAFENKPAAEYETEESLPHPSTAAGTVITGAAITTPAGDPEMSEIDAKLELAKLYREMGDNDAALALMAEIGAQW
ncbi:hypothetical protein [Paludibacterium denitrificans]|uniref:Uncharacterized protein n=1 Tax=Paludibacterium denitrificans TaxID=2675226 RepID=A0A844GEN5_9NEIS|nr:hypothetical protein [Paludibacterium denitrificans]MTD33780.1 hypothetical protein [Paludibacterium denitrificans]